MFDATEEFDRSRLQKNGFSRWDGLVHPRIRPRDSSGMVSIAVSVTASLGLFVALKSRSMWSFLVPSML